jgi:hypothetical protein
MIKIKIRNDKSRKVFTYLKAFSSAEIFKGRMKACYSTVCMNELYETDINFRKIGHELTLLIALYMDNGDLFMFTSMG